MQSFSFEELLLFAQKQLSLAEEVYAVYEAGPLGYVLYRRLRELGIRAYVCAPECLEQGKRKHNKLDARKLASRLYSYVQGDSADDAGGASTDSLRGTAASPEPAT